MGLNRCFELFWAYPALEISSDQDSAGLSLMVGSYKREKNY